jgi:hypothetical protein
VCVTRDKDKETNSQEARKPSSIETGGVGLAEDELQLRKWERMRDIPSEYLVVLGIGPRTRPSWADVFAWV